jgi:hypothetical protein
MGRSARLRMARADSIRFALTLGSLSFLVSAGCTTARAPIGDGLHGPVREVQAEFDRRVRTQFPIGSNAAVLHAELVRQKFMIVRDKTPRSPFRRRIARVDLAA